THLTIDHTMQNLLGGFRDAARTLVLWGLIDKENIARYRHFVRTAGGAHATDNKPPSQIVREAVSRDPQSFFLELSHFHFDPYRGESMTQTFPIHSALSGMKLDFGIVVLEVKDNWGATQTCLYRVRVHGEERD
ncbi:hypothetical protein BJ138DRAFT_1017418, partial [Hygrophoropsis aurantiaca]